ncbi:MAG: PKD domain-containing protein, partial [Bacteroidota bacterium]
MWLLSLCTGWGYSTAYGQVANFTAGQTSGCSPLTVQFAQQATGPVNNYLWDFGNGNTSTLPNPGVIYVNPGTYTVSLTVSDGTNSDTETKTGYITVFADPVADFTLSPTGGCIPFPVSATDLSTPGNGAINQWTWDFGDGTVSNQANPSHTYQTAGMYDVSLTVTDANGCSDTRLIPDLVTASPSLQVSVNSVLPNICQLPYSVDFTSSVNGGGNYTYKWDFGDGGSSNQANPTHAYPQAGTYTVTLITTDPGGCTDTLTLIDEVSIAIPQADFVVSDTVVCAGENLNLINLSTGGTDFEWNFGDGTVFNGPNPQHAYLIPGTYPIRLITRNSQGCADTMVRLSYLTVSPSPVANFGSSNPQACSVPWLINFNDASQGSASWLWDFGDGNTANIANPSHLYTQAGFYTVSLITVGANGCRDTLTRPNYVQIVRPVADFVADTVEGCIPLEVDFQDLSTSAFDSIDTWIWDFGDGGFAIGPAPVHTYEQDGSYDVTLQVEDRYGCTANLTKPQYIELGRPLADFNVRYVPACPPVEVTFTAAASSPYGIQSYQWELGDGTTLTGNPVVHQYLDTGNYVVSLNVVDGLGCDQVVIKDTAVSIFGQQKPAPIAIYAASVVSKEAIRLNWRPSSALDFGAYLVFWQNPNSGNWEQIHETNGRNDSIFLDQRPGQLDCEARSHCYAVIQRNQCGTQGNLNEAPTHCTVEVEAQSLADRILVEWNAYRGWREVDHYDVYRVKDYQQSFDELL